MNSDQAQAVAARFIEFLETGKVPAGLFTANIFCDFTSPRWRLQAEGIGPVTDLRRRGHPRPSKVVRFRCDPTPTGFVLEIEERWPDSGGEWYAREMFRADVTGDAIASVSVYCTGDWDRHRREEHAREVQLLRP